jgi:hypothetical protein
MLEFASISGHGILIRNLPNSFQPLCDFMLCATHFAYKISSRDLHVFLDLVRFPYEISCFWVHNFRIRFPNESSYFLRHHFLVPLRALLMRFHALLMRFHAFRSL